MQIRSILTPVQNLTTLAMTDPAKKAMDIIQERGFLSLPVVEGKTFRGFLSKQFIYDKFFESNEENFSQFLEKPVADFIAMKIQPVPEDLPIEQAANIFFKERVRFLPVTNTYGDFVGILTQKALFSVITRSFGLNDPKIVIHTDDYSGSLSKITDIITKHGANITNITQIDTQIMGIQEITIRVLGKDLPGLVEKLRSKGVKVKEFVEGSQ